MRQAPKAILRYACVQKGKTKKKKCKKTKIGRFVKLSRVARVCVVRLQSRMTFLKS